PGPRSRVRAGWDPKPALGLVIRPSGVWARASGGTIRRRAVARARIAPRARVRGVSGRGGPLGPKGVEFRRGASVGLPRHGPIVRERPDARHKLLIELGNTGRSERI